MADLSLLNRWADMSTRMRSVWLLFAGVLTSLGQAPFDVPVATVLGLIVGFAAFRMADSTRSAIWAGQVFGFGYFAVSLHWIVEPFFVDIARHGWMAPFALGLLAGGMALFWGASFGLAHLMSRSRRARGGLGLTASLVVIWTLAELARAYVLTGFPWAMPSYVLVDGLAGQAASLVGPHGLNMFLFGVAALGSSLLMASGRSRWGGGLVVVAALAAIYGPVPTLEVARDRPIVRLIQPNAPQHQKWDPDYTALFFQRAVGFTKAAPQNADVSLRPDLIIWPETSVPAFLDEAAPVLDVISQAAAGVPVVLGVRQFKGVRLFNSAAVLNADGTLGQVYDKHHLVPFGEYIPFGRVLGRFGLSGMAAENGYGFSAGGGAHLLDFGALGRALPLICYEAVFPQDVATPDDRPDFLLQITNDAWFGSFSGPFQHLAQSRMRAIEQGLPMVRAANTGISGVINSNGVVTHALALNVAGFLDAPLPAPAPPTLYARSGDMPLVFLLLCLAIGLTLRAHFKKD